MKLLLLICTIVLDGLLLQCVAYGSIDSANTSSKVVTWKIPNREVYRPKVAVVLSGGGAGCMAQIGVLKQLEQAGIPID